MKFSRSFDAQDLPRTSGSALMLTVAILAAAIVSTLTVDLGPLLRRPAEREGFATT